MHVAIHNLRQPYNACATRAPAACMLPPTAGKTTALPPLPSSVYCSRCWGGGDACNCNVACNAPVQSADSMTASLSRTRVCACLFACACCAADRGFNMLEGEYTLTVRPATQYLRRHVSNCNLDRYVPIDSEMECINAGRALAPRDRTRLNISQGEHASRLLRPNLAVL